MDEATAREILKEDQAEAIFRVRCLVANYLGVAPETLGPIRRVDREHMAEARENMEIGARIKSRGLVFFNPAQFYMQ